MWLGSVLYRPNVLFQCLSLVRNLNWLNPKWIHHCHCIVKASWKLSSFLLPCKVDLIHSITPVIPTVLPICFWDRHSSSSITTNAKIIPTAVLPFWNLSHSHMCLIHLMSSPPCKKTPHNTTLSYWDCPDSFPLHCQPGWAHWSEWWPSSLWTCCNCWKYGVNFPDCCLNIPCSWIHSKASRIKGLAWQTMQSR